MRPYYIHVGMKLSDMRSICINFRVWPLEFLTRRLEAQNVTRFRITALSGAMATSRQIRRWIFVSRSRTVIRVFLSCLVCSFTLVYFVTFSDNFENGSNWENKNFILSHQVKQRNLKSATFLAQIRNDQSYQLKPNDSRSPLYVNKKFRDLCPFISPLLGKQRIISIVYPLNELTYQLHW